MMHSVRVAMRRDKASYVRLEDLLKQLPYNEWRWSVLYYYGLGKVPYFDGIEAFEDEVNSSTCGVQFSWSELLDFSAHLEQTIDCTVVAVSSEQLLMNAQLTDSFFRSCQIVLEAIDSTEWKILVNDQTGFVPEVLDGIRRV